MDKFTTKTTEEAYYVYFDFRKAIGSAGITSATITVYDSSGNDVTSTLTTLANQYISGTRVYVWVKGGTSGQSYFFECEIVTNETVPATHVLNGELPIEDEI